MGAIGNPLHPALPLFKEHKGFNPQGIEAKLVFSFVNTAFSNVSIRGVIIKQASTPAQATTLCFVDPLFVYRGSKRNYCKQINILISLLVPSYFSIKNQWSCINRFSVFVYVFVYGCKSTTKDSMHNTQLNFRSFFSRKRCTLYMVSTNFTPYYSILCVNSL